MLLYLVKQVELAVRARLDELLRPDGLTALQYTALTVLEATPTCLLPSSPATPSSPPKRGRSGITPER